jgi:TPR repeat protein
MKHRALWKAALAALVPICLAFIGTAWAAPQDDFSAGRKAYLAGDVVAAMTPLKRAADAGYAPAQSLYAYILDKAEYNEEAAQYFRRAAEQGDADGQYGLGLLYATGGGVARDPAAAREWLERAGNQNHALAVVALSQAFLAGRIGFKTDPADAAGLGWVRKAGALDSIPALTYLAQGYRSGAFGAADLKEAERLEARIRELSPDKNLRRGKKK